MIKTQEDFIKKAKEIFNDKYDYSLTIYKKSKDKVYINCPEHGKFLKSPHKHLLGQGCPKCGRLKQGKNLLLKDFLNRSYEVHENKYNYSKVEYVNNRTEVCIICKEHGEFWQKPNYHLMGHGCPKCGLNKTTSINSLSLNDFVKRSNVIHKNKYDYSKVEYVNNRTKVKILCPLHGEFEQKPIHHLTGSGCQECKKNKLKDVMTKSNVDFIKKAKEIFNDKYEYRYVDYKNSKEKVCIICKEHGEFWQKPNYHLMGHGCPKCNQSKGERLVEQWLLKNNIQYENQKSFKECRNKFSLPFDFYLTEYNICIEYDGQQHFKPVCFGGISYDKALLEFKKCQKRDEIKNMFCKKNNIKLIRISYFENVDKLLNSLFKF